MPKRNCEFEPDVCYHVLNRGNNRQAIFHKDGDYEAFLTVLTIALARFEVDLLCWCLMPNHWHLVLRPRRRGNFSAFMRWLTRTHVLRYQRHYPDLTGHLYQGRFRSFPVESDDYFLVLGRYVEANPLRAKLVDRAEDWKWSSLRQRIKRQSTPPLVDWPVDRPSGWLESVNDGLLDEQVKSIRKCVDYEMPLGSSAWIARTLKRLGMVRPPAKRGRPLKPTGQISIRQRQRRQKAGAKRPT